MKFILSRTNDFENHSKKWIVGYGLLFWLVTRLIAFGLVIGCVAIYNAYGLNPEEMTKFSGDPGTAKSLGSPIYVFLTACLLAPLLEECIFRLGLSFKRWQVALAAAAIPTYILWQRFNILNASSIVIYAVGIIGVFCLIYFLTSDSFWRKQKSMYYKPMIWLSAIAFGLIHLIAFSNYSITLLPYMLCLVSVPFFAGCAITYYRVNLGFWWGVGLHIFNNLPAVAVLLTM